MHRLVIAVALGLLTLTHVSQPARAANTGDQIRHYPLGNAGTLTLTLADGLTDEVRTTAIGAPPTIVISAADKHRCQALITPVWRFNTEVMIPDQAGIQKFVSGAASNALSEAVETTLPLTAMTGIGGAGYYFHATDKAPKPDEYKYMTQGMVRTGDIAIAFTVLSNDGGEPDLASMLRLIAHASFAAAKP